MIAKRKSTAQEKAQARKEAKEAGVCRYCGLDVKRFSTRRSTFCSDECVQAFLIREDPGAARKAVYKRDKGICQICGMNCSKWFGEFKRFIREIPYSRKEEAARDYFEDHKVPYVPDWKHRSTFWDCDHKVEVATGDFRELNTLDNLHLICIPCHRVKTVEFNKTRPRKTNSHGIMGAKECNDEGRTQPVDLGPEGQVSPDPNQ